MIYGNFFSDDPRGKNAMFGELVESPMGYYELLKEHFQRLGIEINTPDVNYGKTVSFDLHIEGRHLIGDDNVPRYLIALENPNHNQLNGSQLYFSNFSKVFTWNAELLNLVNVIKVLPPHQISHSQFSSYHDRDIFSTLINGNKAFRKKLPTDLYSERISTIRWYERNAPDEFELYGRGWDKPPPAFDLVGKMRRSIPSLGVKLLKNKCFPSYRGELQNKSEVLRRSKFSYCYENNRDLSNYITEKIIDAFVSGCVPIYWGADNILDYIPAGCFIDRRNFRNTAEVHQHLLSISPEVYSEYQSNISKFLQSDVAKRFSFEHFVSVVTNEIAQDFDL
ncbi:glycosyltransferase family 10 domain-containing protein [Polynucleobacter sp. CS-Odin-A6]|uniref:glycosyltransferase family 10 domain-containing protein n=1 Tax=Polynucleobacter sp. CS-Odin-A6 TaxID=2689106 RepID=UPI001C0D47BB|nr:glycosyltransferase family 10 [Polynucleobacter sp. CS-Odin-A6]MBU3621192.1 hypothetical protein [Polynucleobacter sp. CS-Odin-A6]